MSGWSIKTSNLTQQHQEKGPLYKRKRKHTSLAQRAFSPPYTNISSHFYVPQKIKIMQQIISEK